MSKPTGNFQVYYNNELGQQVPYVHTTLGPLAFRFESMAKAFQRSLEHDQEDAIDAGFMDESDTIFWFVKHCPNLPLGFTFKVAGYRYQMPTDPTLMVTYAYLGGPNMDVWKYHVGLVISTSMGEFLPEHQKVYGDRKDLQHNIDGRVYVDFFTDTEEEIRKVMLR